MIELLRSRRSTRKFSDRDIEPDKIEVLKESVLRSPTSKNNKPCNFIFISNKELLHKLSECKPHGAAFLKNASLGVVVCANNTKSDVWVEDSSIASILLQITAQSLGLGSCWVQIRKRQYNAQISAEDYIKGQLELSANVRVESIIAIGYKAENREPLSYEELDLTKISYR